MADENTGSAIDPSPEDPSHVPTEGGGPIAEPVSIESPPAGEPEAGSEQTGGTPQGETDAPPAPTVKRPRGRPRKDGLPPGSPEAKAADEGKGATGGDATAGQHPPSETPGTGGGIAPVVQPAESPPVAPLPPKVREAPARTRERQPRARPVAELPKQEPPKNVCTNVNCRATHPSQGGKAGVRCVETGALVVAPLGREEGRELVKQILGWIGKIVSYAFGGEVSDPTGAEMALITPPTIRLLHRFGIGEGNLTLDILMLLAGLSMYTMRVISEAREGGKRVALPAAA